MKLQDRLKAADKLILEFQSMRLLQKKYFNEGREYKVLNQSKAQEKKVDQMIGEYNNNEIQGRLW